LNTNFHRFHWFTLSKTDKQDWNGKMQDSRVKHLNCNFYCINIICYFCSLTVEEHLWFYARLEWLLFNTKRAMLQLYYS
jgi:hypothetical protein